MPSFPVFLLQVSVTLCLFWIVHFLFIRRIRLFAMQRTYLIAGLILSLTLPFIYPAFPVQETVDMSEWVPVLSPDQFSSPELTSPEAINSPGHFSWLGILLAIYCTGVAFRLSLLVREALAIRNLYLSGEREYAANYVVIHSPSTKRTFSFFRLIFLGNRMAPESRHFAVLHEYAHVWGYHSWDNLLFELARVLLWFHPAIHHFKKYLNEVHEFLADEYVVSTCGTPKAYAEFLFAHTCQTEQRLKLGLSNKLITKRIVMLSKPSIHRLNHLFLLILIPLALAGLAACSMFEKEPRPVNEIEGLATANDSNSEYKGRIIRNISWNGNVAFSDAVLNESLGIRPGDSFDNDELATHLGYNSSGNDITSMYMDNGYLFFTINAVIGPVSEDKVDLIFNIYEGDVMEIGTVCVTSDEGLQTSLMDYVDIRPGQLFSRSALVSSIQILQAETDGMEVTATPTPVPEQGVVNLEFVITKKEVN